MSRKDFIQVHGFFRIQIGKDDGKVIHDSGWKKNVVVNLGFQDYICASIGNVAGSKQIVAAALGTGAAPAATDTALAGETRVRKTTVNTVVTSKTLQCVASWSSSDNSATVTLANIGLFNTTAASGTLICGNTYNSSTWGTDQNVSMTYQLRFT